MIGRRLGHVILSLCAVCFVAILLIPMGALILRVSLEWNAAPGQSSPSPRQWWLFGRTMGLAVAGTVVALSISLPGAYVVGRMGRPSAAPWLVLVVLMPLMLSPTVSAFGWQRLLGAHSAWLGDWSPWLRCVWNWASWAWPIPALILGAGWSRVGRSAYESALLVSPPASAFVRAVIPSLSRHVLVSVLVLLIVFSGEYSVPHAHGVVVLATELLDVARYGVLVDTLRLSLPSIIASLAMFLVMVIVWRRRPGEDAPGRIEGVGSAGLAAVFVVLLVLITTILPIAILAWRSTIAVDMAAALETYGDELSGTVLVCLFSGILVTATGIAVVTGGRLRIPALVLAMLPGVVPGALTGEAVLAAYQPVGWFYSVWPIADVGWWIYNHWPIVAIGLAARFSWIGVLAAWLATKSASRDLSSQASVDGAGDRIGGVLMPLIAQWPTLLCGALLASAMAASEVAVVSLLQVPTLPMLSGILMEKFHRFETGMLVSLSLWMVACAAPGAILAFVVLRRRE